VLTFQEGSLGETDTREKGGDLCTSAGILPDVGRRRSGKRSSRRAKKGAAKSPRIMLVVFVVVSLALLVLL
jgi:hypothetical protein